MKHSLVQVDKLLFAVMMLGFTFFAVWSYGEDCATQLSPNDPIVQAFNAAVPGHSLFDKNAVWESSGLKISFDVTNQNHPMAKFISISDEFVKKAPLKNQLMIRVAQRALQSHPMNQDIAVCMIGHRPAIDIHGQKLYLSPLADSIHVSGQMFHIPVDEHFVRTSAAVQ